MPQFEVTEAAADFAELVDRAMAGEDIVFARDGRPVARLIPAAGNSLSQIRGIWRGRVEDAEDAFGTD
jgi:prevent-host-death family protein